MAPPKIFPAGSRDVPLLEIQGMSCNYGLERAVYDLSLTAVSYTHLTLPTKA